jgi:hypothetical protein
VTVLTLGGPTPPHLLQPAAPSGLPSCHEPMLERTHFEERSGIMMTTALSRRSVGCKLEIKVSGLN